MIQLKGDADDQDAFGSALAVSGDDAAIGSPDAFGRAPKGGVVNTFRRVDGVWTAQGVLFPDDGEDEDAFGTSVGLSGDILVVGAPRAGLQGAAYVYERAADGWLFRQRLTGTEASVRARFGCAVAVLGDRVVIGARDASSGDLSGAGAAYVFTRGGDGTWEQARVLGPARPMERQGFGASLALSASFVVIGAPDDDTLGSRTGRAYVFRLGGARPWTERSIVPNDPASQTSFGSSVATDGEVVVVGAPGRGGRAFVFGSLTFPGDDQYDWRWVQQADLAPPQVDPYQDFGAAVGVSSDTVVVGAWQLRVADTGSAGAAYAFDRRSQLRVSTLDAEPSYGSRFGHAVVIDGDTILVGAPQQADPTSAGPFPLLESSTHEGAVSAYTRRGGVWSRAQVLTGERAAFDQFGSAVGAASATVIVAAPGTRGRLGCAHVYEIVSEDGGVTAEKRARLGTPPGHESSGFGAAVAVATQPSGVAVVGAPKAEVAGVKGAGAVWLHGLRDGTWVRLSTPLNASEPRWGDAFGSAVAIDEDVLVVGAPGNDGAAYVFRRVVGSTHPDPGRPSLGAGKPVLGSWKLESRLPLVAKDHAESGSRFGHAVAVSGRRVLVGAPGTRATDVGLVHVYAWSEASGWVLAATLEGARAGDRFGTSVGVDGDVVVVGSPGRTECRVVRFLWNEEHQVWVEQTLASSPAEDRLGIAVAAGGDHLIYGADRYNGRGRVVLGPPGYSVPAPTLGVSDPHDGMALGASVALSGSDWGVAGAPSDHEAGPLSGSAFVFSMD